MKNAKLDTNLPERRQMEHPPPEKKPKWSKLLGTVFRGILIWMPRLWKVIDFIFRWVSEPPS